MSVVPFLYHIGLNMTNETTSAPATDAVAPVYSDTVRANAGPVPTEHPVLADGEVGSKVLDFQVRERAHTTVQNEEGAPFIEVKGDGGVVLYRINRDGSLYVNPDLPDAETKAASVFFRDVGQYMTRFVSEAATEMAVPYILAMRRVKSLGVVKTRRERELVAAFSKFPDGTYQTQLPQLDLKDITSDLAVVNDISSIERLIAEGKRLSDGMRDGYPRVLMSLLAFALNEYHEEHGENDPVKRMLTLLTTVGTEEA